MFFSGLLKVAGILISAVIFLALLAFWVVFGVKKFKWALITSIILTVLFVMSGGLLGLRMAFSTGEFTARRLSSRFDRAERFVERMESDIFPGRKVPGFRKFRRADGPKIEFKGTDEEELEKIRENWDEIESITVNVNIDVEYEKD